MKILVTGRGGKAGSWAVRGEQLGAAMGSTVKPMATLADCKAADVIVVIKRVPDVLLQTIRQSGRPWVYDIVDAYPQPECSGWSEAQRFRWLREHLARLAPDAVVWPTRRMQVDSGGVRPGWVLYHHHRPGIEVNPVRERIELVGYDGAPHYLEGWLPVIEAQCKRIGARFVVNPAQLAQVDVVLALRGGQWGGLTQQVWKSNVKLANAHASGTPFIGAPEAGYVETLAGGELFAIDEHDLARSLDWFASQNFRRVISSRFLAAAYSVDQAAADMRAALCAWRS